MAITVPNSTPTNYSDPSITRYGLISGLNIVNVMAQQMFYDTYGFAAYTQLAMLQNAYRKVDNKMFTWYQSHGRTMGFVTANANVTVANGASAVITVGAGGYSQSGTKSLPALGYVFRNSRTGVDIRVNAVPNKTTANAHTFSAAPLLAGQNASVLAGDELLGRGFLYLGDQSDKTDTIIKTIDKYTNYCTQIRTDDEISDLADAERIEFMINGQHSYTLKQLKDTDMRRMMELDFLIFEGTRADNLPYVEEGSNGVIKQVQANGINMDYTTWSLATFSTINRALNSMGAPKEYDILSDNGAMTEMQNSIFTEINNGGIVYSQAGSRNGIDLNRDFQSMKIYERKYNFSGYGLFDEQTVYGSQGLGVRNRFSLFIPVGNSQVMYGKSSPTVSAPRFSINYQTPFNQNRWHVKENGLHSDGGGTKAGRIVTTIGYFGSQLVGAQQFLIAKGS